MGIVKINIHKVHADRNLNAKPGQVNINNNVSLLNVEEMDFGVQGKRGLKFTFSFVCEYEPDLGKISVEGQVLFLEEEKRVKEIKAGWDKNKRVPMDIMEQVANAALHKGNIQAIKISEEVNLPSPLPLPKIKASPVAGQASAAGGVAGEKKEKK